MTTLGSLPSWVSWALGPRPTAPHRLSPSCSSFFSCLESRTPAGGCRPLPSGLRGQAHPAPHSLGSWPASLCFWTQKIR